MTPDSLSSRIGKILDQKKSKVLLRDDQVAWTGAVIQSKMQSLSEMILQSTLEGSAVGVSFPNLAVQAFAILTILRARRVPVVLSHSELNSDVKEWVTRSKISLLITMPGFEHQLEERVRFVTLSRNAEVVVSNLGVSRFHLSDLIAPPPAGTGLVLFTSGSTGKPKGICVPENGILKTIDFLIPYFDLNDRTVSPIILPICHSMALNTQFFPTFFAGGVCHFINPRLSINKLYRTILAEKGTFVSLIGEVLRACWEEKMRRELPSAEHVEHVQLAGGMISEKHLNMAKALFPRAVIHKGYGLTEAIRATMVSSKDNHFHSNTVGKPLPFVDIEIRDGNGVIQEQGKLGQVYIRGPNILLGTMEKHPSLLGSDGFLPTGDLGMWNNEGQLCIMGREDSLYKINGHRISGVEIEKIAIDTSDLIKNARCMVIEDDREKKKLILMLEIQIDSQEKFLGNVLPEIHQKMWDNFRSMNYFPREVILLQKFPRTANGKVNLKKLYELYASEPKFNLLHSSYSNLQFYKITSQEYERLSV